MQIQEFNEKLRNSLMKIKESGFKVSDIGSLLMSSSTSQISRFLKDETDFGIKPITKIADQVQYDIMVVAVKRDDNNEDLVSAMNECTELFFEDLYDDATECLNIRYAGNNTGYLPRNTISRATIDALLNELEI